MLPARLPLCDLEAPLGGASVSALCFCCFLAHRLLYGIFVICCSLWFYFAIPIPGVIQCSHLFWYVSDDYELTSWSPTVLFLGCVLFCSWFVCVGFVLLLPCGSCLVCVGWLSSHGDSSMDYVSILLSFTFGAHCRYNDVAIALIRWIWNPPTPLWRWRRAYWGANSYTKCSITFVNIAVAISALAPKNGFAPRPEFGGVFDIFRGFLGVWAQEGIEMEFWVIWVAFRQWKNGQKWKKVAFRQWKNGQKWKKHCT